MVVIGARDGERWVYVRACKQLCLARVAAGSLWCLRTLKSLVSTPMPSVPLYPKSLVIPANWDAHSSLIARSSLLSPWAGGTGDRARHIKKKEQRGML